LFRKAIPDFNPLYRKHFLPYSVFGRGRKRDEFEPCKLITVEMVRILDIIDNLKFSGNNISWLPSRN
jgi:hypothetical protein